MPLGLQVSYFDRAALAKFICETVAHMGGRVKEVQWLEDGSCTVTYEQLPKIDRLPPYEEWAQPQQLRAQKQSAPPAPHSEDLAFLKNTNGAGQHQQVSTPEVHTAPPSTRPKEIAPTAPPEPDYESIEWRLKPVGKRYSELHVLSVYENPKARIVSMDDQGNPTVMTNLDEYQMERLVEQHPTNDPARLEKRAKRLARIRAANERRPDAEAIENREAPSPFNTLSEKDLDEYNRQRYGSAYLDEGVSSDE